MAEILHFKVSSGLKNIIGRELINDKYIAIFELVKNSYDAGAKHVRIKFDNLGSEAATITIIDDGVGMTKEDIIQKWLFVAYSEKKNPSYRDRIKRSVAGAKGVGRFSCDRLGESVSLSSKTVSEHILHRITILWSDFEKNAFDDFTDIDVQYEALQKKDDTSGTSIVISRLREKWTHEDLLALKKALSQLVNPSAKAEYDTFDIVLDVPQEKDSDKEKENERDRINGIIVNQVFEVLSEKTTKIEVCISADGKTIQTTLNDRGIFLFKAVEKNEFSLRDISCELFFLNRSAKVNFTRKMGVEAVNYGSVFIYKNGFRVYPYGEPGRDFFDIDQRKQQGYKRFLGTRELIGQIEINGDKNNFVETSSRNNGFIASADLDQLELFWKEYVLKPLEKYVVNIVEWGNTDDLASSPVDASVFSNMEQVVYKIKTRSKPETFVSIECNDDLASIISQYRSDKESSIEQLRKLAEKTNNEDIIKKAEQVARQTKELQKEVKQANIEAEERQKHLNKAQAELAATQKQVGFLMARADLTAQDAIDAMHIMKGYADAIDSNIHEIYEINEDSKQGIDTIRPLLDAISQICKKIINSYNLVMRTEYSAGSDVVKADLIQFVTKYCEEFNGSLHITVEKPLNRIAKVKFVPLEFSIVLDNIIDNSRKANSNNLVLRFEEGENEIILRCTDDGYGIRMGTDENRLFEPGYTTTSGSGIGLSTIKKYIEKRGGRVSYNPDYKKGFEIILHMKNGD